MLTRRDLLLYLFFIALFLTYSEAYAQSLGYKKGFQYMDSYSLELGVGLPKLITPTNDVKVGDAGIISVALRYLPIDKQLGVRAVYSFSSISDASSPATDHDNSLEIHRFELQGVYMLNELLYLPEELNFDLESYLGFGGAFGMPSAISNSNRMLSASIGVRPRLLVNKDNLYVYFDASYAVLINQQWNYSGQRIINAKKGNLESMLQLSLGISYRL